MAWHKGKAMVARGVGRGFALGIGACLLFGAVAACKRAVEEKSRAKVVGGEKDEERYKAAVRLSLIRGNKRGLCTGTFVSDTTVLTASHCLEGATAVELDDGRRSTRLIINERFVKAKASSSDPSKISQGNNHHLYDIALVIFPARDGQSTLFIAPTRPAVGSKVEFIGYGANDMKHVLNEDKNATGDIGADERRWGTNVLIDASRTLFTDMLVFVGPASSTGVSDRMSIGEGDSGGPLIVNNQLVGVAALVSPASQQGQNSIYSAFTSLYTPENQAFLQQAVATKGASIKGFGEDGDEEDAASEWYIPVAAKPGDLS